MMMVLLVSSIETLRCPEQYSGCGMLCTVRLFSVSLRSLDQEWSSIYSSFGFIIFERKTKWKHNIEVSLQIERNTYSAHSTIPIEIQVYIPLNKWSSNDLKGIIRKDVYLKSKAFYTLNKTLILIHYIIVWQQISTYYGLLQCDY